MQANCITTNRIISIMYIKKFYGILPIGIFSEQSNITEMSAPDVAPFLVNEPEYTSYIAPMQLRRMSKPVRMGVFAAKKLMDKNPESLAAINVASAYGLLKDSELFLAQLLERKEQMLHPTSFIQSTHNTVAGSIALALSCSEHNLTYVHSGHSFENALLDIKLLSFEKNNCQFLLGGTDECTPSFLKIFQQFAIYQSAAYPDAPLAGEGSVFFLLSNNKEEAIASIQDFSFWVSENEDEIFEKINAFLQLHCITNEGKEVFVSGNTKSVFVNKIYSKVQQTYFANDSEIAFKNYCGEYPTAVAFGVALAAQTINCSTIPKAVVLNNFGKYWSIYLIAR